VRRDHLAALTGPLGIWQHAAGAIPDEAFGTCTDDVARALLVDLLHARELGWAAVRDDALRSVRYLREALDPSTGRFRNFRAADGQWLETAGSEDSNGRAMLALGIAVRDGRETEVAVAARSIFDAALPATGRLTALRATASALLGCEAALDAGLGGATRVAFDRLAGRLRRAFVGARLESSWPWPEPSLTYENALLPRALLAAGARLGDRELRDAGLRTLDWVIDAQTTPRGTFSPIGSDGWWRRGGARARFDQQPIEATATILAARDAFRVTGERRYAAAAEAAFGWFLGDNDIGVRVADPRTGACHDGLTPTGVNLNQGAESTLMWLIALEEVRRMRRNVVETNARRREPIGAIAAVVG
jgi:hypothetical protein